MFDFYCRRTDFWRGVDVLIAPKIHGRVFGDILRTVDPLVLRDVSYEEYEKSRMLPKEPTLCLQDEEAVALMDALWNVGIRPSNGEGAVGQIGAIKYHLEDLRRLVFGATKAADDAR